MARINLEYELTKKSSVLDAYVAGVMDGDGHFSIYYKTKEFGDRIGLHIKMGCRTTIEFIAKYLDLPCIYFDVAKEKNRKNMFGIRAHGDVAVSALLPLYPYAIYKRQRYINLMHLDGSEKFSMDHSPERDAYFAGIIDAEGWVSIRTVRSSGENKKIRPVIQVTMICKETIFSLKSYFGVGYIKVLPAKGNRQETYKWVAESAGAKKVAAIIKPYSITKKDNIENIINIVDKKPGFAKGTRTGNNCPSSIFSQEQVDTIRDIHAKEIAQQARIGKKRARKGFVNRLAQEYGVKKETMQRVFRFGYNYTN